MSGKSVMIRVNEATRDILADEIRRLREANARGFTDVLPPGETWTMDFMVSQLIRMYEGRRRRRRRAAQRRRERRRAERRSGEETPP